MSRRDLARVRHMVEAAHKLQRYTEGRSRADLDNDEVLTLAVTRLLEIMGEAAKAVPEPIKQACPDVPWRAIAGTRDRLIHGYFEVDLDIVWQIIQVELSPLIAALGPLLEDKDASP